MALARFIPAPDQGDAQVVVLAVELFEAATVVVLATTVWEELIASGLVGPEAKQALIADDVGTEYRRAFQAGHAFAGDKRRWSDSNGVHRLNLEFEPPVPPEATYLRIALGPWGNVVVMI
jgi:hypothetical protein